MWVGLDFLFRHESEKWLSIGLLKLLITCTLLQCNQENREKY